jgi:hypothetical protein
MADRVEAILAHSGEPDEYYEGTNEIDADWFREILARKDIFPDNVNIKSLKFWDTMHELGLSFDNLETIIRVFNYNYHTKFNPTTANLTRIVAYTGDNSMAAAILHSFLHNRLPLDRRWLATSTSSGPGRARYHLDYLASHYCDIGPSGLTVATSSPERDVALATVLNRYSASYIRCMALSELAIAKTVI